MHPSPSAAYYQQASERLTFRALTLQDSPAWIPFFTNNSGLRFVGAHADDLSPEEKSLKWIERQIDRAAKAEFGQLAVCRKDTGEFIGVGGIISRDLEGVGELEITYSLLQVHQGNGFATELARHFMTYAQQHLHISSLISLIHVDNAASMNVAMKNGLHRERQIEFMEMPVYIYRIQC